MGDEVRVRVLSGRLLQDMNKVKLKQKLRKLDSMIGKLQQHCDLIILSRYFPNKYKQILKFDQERKKVRQELKTP